jgi:hypothetical protein
MVDGGGRCRAAVERRNEGFDGVALSPVGEVGALFVVGFGGGEVEGVGFAAAAQRRMSRPLLMLLGVVVLLVMQRSAPFQYRMSV